MFHIVTEIKDRALRGRDCEINAYKQFSSREEAELSIIRDFQWNNKRILMSKMYGFFWGVDYSSQLEFKAKVVANV